MPRYRQLTRKDWIVTALLIAIMMALIIGGEMLIRPRYPAGFVLWVCMLLFLLVYWHASNHAFHCPACGHEFEISVWKDLTGPNRVTTKYLRCPACGKRDWANCLRKT
jgi:hypothetical protein